MSCLDERKIVVTECSRKAESEIEHSIMQLERNLLYFVPGYELLICVDHTRGLQTCDEVGDGRGDGQGLRITTGRPEHVDGQKTVDNRRVLILAEEGEAQK